MFQYEMMWTNNICEAFLLKIMDNGLGNVLFYLLMTGDTRAGLGWMERQDQGCLVMLPLITAHGNRK